jgi:hypothetical protein
VLHCDKLSWFGHIQAQTVCFVVPDLNVSGDSGLNGGQAADELSVRQP